MVKDFLLIRAAPGVPHKDVQQYLEHVHAPLALATPALAREVRRYTMNHVRDAGMPGIALHPAMPSLALIVEHMFGGWEGIARFSADARYLATVRPDEQHMVKTLMDGAPQFVAVDEEVPVYSGVAPANLRMFDFVRRPRAMSAETFRQRLNDEAEWVRGDPAYRAAVARRVHSIVGAGAADFGTDAEPLDAVIETWIADAGLLAARVVPLRSRRAAFCDMERCFTVISEERWIGGDADAFGPRGPVLAERSAPNDRSTSSAKE